MWLIVLIFIIVPLAELYVIIQVGGVIGLIPTLVLLLADALLGSMLLRHQGRSAWIQFNRALAENRLPHKEVFDGILVIMGGALLITPGFITDVIGLVLLVPPTRHLVRRLARRSIERRTVIVAGAPASRRGGRPDPGAYDVEGTASEVDWETRRLPR